jgi:hypothetical protein
MNLCRSLLVVVALAGLAGCPSKDADDEAPRPQPTQTTPPPPPATVASAPAAPLDLKVEGTGNPKIEPRVKAELDGRADGITGTALSVSGATASLQTPTGWTTTKGDINVSATADNKSQLAATSGGSEKLAAATGALGLTACEWSAVENVTVGASKVAATAADGICTRGTTQVKMAYVSPTAEKLLVVGAWEPGGDAAAVFGSMRSIAKAGGGGGDATGIRACCNALAQNAKSAPPEQQMAYAAAAAACNGLINNPQGRQALSQVRGMLRGANMPSSCQ